MEKNMGGYLIVGLLLWLLLRRQPEVQVSNEETWTWTDWQGNKRTITVHRKVKNG